MRRLFPLFILLLLASFGVAQTQDIISTTPPELLIYNVWVRPTAATPAEGATPEPPLPGTVTSAYMTIENTSTQDFQLVGIDDNFAEMSMLHETSLDDGGVARMRMVGALDIPAGGRAALAPAGYHAMLMNLTRDLYPDDAVQLMLTFMNNSGETFSIPVGAVVNDYGMNNTFVGANAAATVLDDGSLGISSILYNFSDEPEILSEVTSSLGGDISLFDPVTGQNTPLEPVSFPAQLPTPFPAEGLLLHLSNFTSTPNEAFTLTLKFQSGIIIGFAVPVLAGEAE